MLTAILAAAALAASLSADYRPAFDPAWDKPAVTPPNEVLVLGTPHLSEFAARDYPTTFAPLLDKLAAFRPAIITIESLSGLQCYWLRQYPARYADTVATYCWDPAPARAATSLDVPAANAEAERLLATLGTNPSAAQRRRLAAVFLSAGERASALVQWLRLPLAERFAADGLDAALVSYLEKLRSRQNEDYAIAVPLAVRLGLDRIYATDDHSSDFTVADEAGFAAAMKAAWGNPVGERRKAGDAKLMADLNAPGRLLDMYRGFNDPAMTPLIEGSDFGAALRDRSTGRFGRRYVGGWETRNLRMVANIRDALAAAPGSRLLTIVGVSHKPYFEAYLNQLRDVRVVDARTVLR